MRKILSLSHFTSEEMKTQVGLVRMLVIGMLKLGFYGPRETIVKTSLPNIMFNDLMLGT